MTAQKSAVFVAILAAGCFLAWLLPDMAPLILLAMCIACGVVYEP